MNLRRFVRLAAATALLGTMAVGCQQQQTTGSGESPQWSSDSWGLHWGHTPRAEPAPAPAPAPAAAPAPAPIVRGGCSPNVPAGMNATSMAFPTGDTASSAIMLHTMMPREVRQGQNYPAEIHVCNLTRGTLQNVIVAMDTTSNMSLISSVPPSARGSDGSTQWSLGELGPNETKVIKLQAKADQVGQSSTCMRVSYNNSVCAATTVVNPALIVTKTGPAEALLCNEFEYRVEVKNTGTGLANNVRVRDNLPAGLATVDGKTQVELDAGNLAAGQAKTATIRVKAARPGRYENNASATADGGLTAQSGNVATVVRQPTLAITAECTGGPILIGRNSTCKFTVRNTGDTACAVTVTAVVPAGLQFVSADNNGAASGGRVSWSVGNLGPNESRTVSMTVRNAAAGSFTCSASASCACAETVTGTCNFSVQGVADIGTLVTDNDGVREVGEPQVFTISTRNQGQIDLTNVRMAITLPEAMSYVSSTGARAPTVAGKVVTFEFGALKPGEIREYTMTATSSRAGEFLITGITTADQIRTPIRDDELTVFIEKP